MPHAASPPQHHEIPHNPVLDRDALGPTEDLDREPDGVPHVVVGLTVVFSALLALLVAVMFATGRGLGKTAAIVLALMAIPTLVSSLRARADRLRDHVHPSR
jgi:hypothetical protein